MRTQAGTAAWGASKTTTTTASTPGRRMLAWMRHRLSRLRVSYGRDGEVGGEGFDADIVSWNLEGE